MQQPKRIILPNMFDGTTVNAWLFTGDMPTLVDTGMQTDDTWDAMVEQLGSHDLAITDIQKIVITHGHADHMGLAARIAEESGAKVWVPEYLLPWAIDLKNQIDIRAAIYDNSFNSVADEQLFPFESWGSSKLMKVWDPLTEDQVVVFKNDDKIQLGDQTWQTIYTPGHCLNQVVFYHEPSRGLISADMILRSTPVPYLDALPDDPTRRGLTIQPLLDSYERIAQLEVDHVYPGHYDQMGDPTLLINKQVGRLTENIGKVKTWIQEGVSSFPDIINRLYPNRVNDSTFFVVISILDHLMANGEIESKLINEKQAYFPTMASVPVG